MDAPTANTNASFAATSFTQGRRTSPGASYANRLNGESASDLAISQLVPEVADGDLGRDALNIAAALTAQGARCEIVGGPGKNPDASLAAQMHRSEVHFEPMPLGRKGLRALSKNRKTLERHLKLFGPSLIHAHSRAPAWAGLRVARRLDVPFVTTFHGLYNYRLKLKRRYNSVMARGDRVIAPSQFVRAHIEGHYPEAEGRIRVIPRGIDLTHFNRQNFSQTDVLAVREHYGLQPNRPILVCSGRLSFWKGQHLFIDLMRRIADLNAYGLIFSRIEGQSEYRMTINNSIKRWRLQDNVRVITDPVDMRPVYLSADAVVSTAIEPEAFVHSIAEAMVLGQPVIAPDHGAAPEQITHHETGWLYKPNDLDALEQAVREAIGLDTEQRANLGQWAMEDAFAAYDARKSHQATLDVYRELVPLPQ